MRYYPRYQFRLIFGLDKTCWIRLVVDRNTIGLYRATAASGSFGCDSAYARRQDGGKTFMAYIWQRDDWPAFRWDEKAIDAKAAACSPGNVEVAADMDCMSEDVKTDAMIDSMVIEAQKSSEIEGEYYSREDLRSSIRNHLRPNTPAVGVGDPKAIGIAKLTVSSRKNFNKPLTKERLWEWQSEIVADKDPHGNRIEKGCWRTGPIVVASDGEIQMIHHEGPPLERVPAEMDRFLEWFNGGRRLMNGVVRAGVAHLYFECIHPFGDGNGRVGRAIADVALSQGAGRPAPMSISMAIRERRYGYYEELKRANTGDLDITAWLGWFADTIWLAQEMALEKTKLALFKTRLCDKHSLRFNDRQSLVVARLFRSRVEGFKGGVNASQYAEMAQCDIPTARRDLAELRSIGAVEEHARFGRRRRYNINLRGR